jgi:hypothetical protein
MMIKEIECRLLDCKRELFAAIFGRCGFALPQNEERHLRQNAGHCGTFVVK